MSDKWEEKEKDRIVQLIYDKLEKFDWGGDFHKMVIKLPFKGKFNLMDIEADIKEKVKQM